MGQKKRKKKNKKAFAHCLPLPLSLLAIVLWFYVATASLQMFCQLLWLLLPLFPSLSLLFLTASPSVCLSVHYVIDFIAHNVVCTFARFAGHNARPNEATLPACSRSSWHWPVLLLHICRPGDLFNLLTSRWLWLLERLCHYPDFGFIASVCCQRDAQLLLLSLSLSLSPCLVRSCRVCDFISVDFWPSA